MSNPDTCDSDPLCHWGPSENEKCSAALTVSCRCFANSAVNELYCASGLMTDPYLCHADPKCHWGPSENSKCTALLEGAVVMGALDGPWAAEGGLKVAVDKAPPRCEKATAKVCDPSQFGYRANGRIEPCVDLTFDDPTLTPGVNCSLACSACLSPCTLLDEHCYICSL